MANLIPEEENWEDEIEAMLTTDQVIGEAPGFTGAVSSKINRMFRAVLNRTRWLRGNQVPVNDATISSPGVVELANPDEARGGSDATRVMTPARSKDFIESSVAQATTEKRGTVELATQAEVNAGIDDRKVITPATLPDVSVASANTERAGIVERANQNEARSGTDTSRYASIAGILDMIRNGSPFRATDSRFGTARRASQSKVDAGVDNEDFVTASTLQGKLSKTPPVTGRVSGQLSGFSDTFTGLKGVDFGNFISFVARFRAYADNVTSFRTGSTLYIEIPSGFHVMQVDKIDETITSRARVYQVTFSEPVVSNDRITVTINNPTFNARDDQSGVHGVYLGTFKIAAILLRT